MKHQVLIVDDSQTVRQQVGTALIQGGLDIVEACDGNEGIDRIRAGGISCVICDVNMPNKNGLEMVEEVKRDSANCDLPIVMLTTEGAPDLVHRARNAGAAGWVVKPFKADMLVAAVKKLIGPAQPA